MTREEAKKAAEVMKAYAEDKDIEYKVRGDDKWSTFFGNYKDSILSFDFFDCEYRIKKEPTYRPFKDKEECWNEMQKHQPFGWVKKTNSDPYIGDTYTLVQYISDRVDYMGYFAEYTFADGTPFGVKE